MEYKLRDLYKVSNGLSKGGSFFGSGFPFISFSTVFNNFFVPEEINDFVQSTLKEQVTYSIKKGDILITRTSETIDELGMSCVALKDYPTATFNGFCKRLRPLTDNVYPHFIGYYLRTPYFRSNFTKVASLITRASLRNEDLLRFSIELPPIYKQKKIAEILYSYDNLIENNNKRIKLLGQMAENLYKEWFVRFRFPGYENVEFEEKKPRSWKVGTEEKKHLTPSIFKYDEFKNIGNFLRGKNITAAKMVEGDIPVISAGLQPSGYHNEANVFGESLTISASGANAGYLQYHLQDIWAADCSYYQDDSIIWFVYNTLKFSQPVISNLQCGAAQPHVYPKNINKLCVLIPTEELIYKYNDFVKPYYDEIKILNQRNQLLTKQRDMLLPRLMSGKLEV